MAHKLLAAMDHSHQCHNPSKDDVFWTKKNASPRVFHFCRGGVRNLSTHGSNGFWAKAKRFNPGPAHPPTTCAFSSLHSVVACPVVYRPTGCGDEITKQSQIRGRRCHPYVFSLAEQSQTKKIDYIEVWQNQSEGFSAIDMTHIKASLDAAGGGTSLTLRRSASNSSCQSGRVTMNQR